MSCLTLLNGAIRNGFGKASFSTTQSLQQIIKLSRLRVVDNSALGRAAMQSGKPPRCIHVYKNTGVGTIGDKILVAIMGQKKRGYIIGCRQKQAAGVPRFDSNNMVLVDDSGTPLGTRIRVPVPSCLRGKATGDFSKVLAIASKFV
ncbi:PREDICTED: 39S ribosomal protein L14, mitochondrial-like [Priapulus caudatus]|uniref:Large ribosomal subunit protein uL14m n=1 Tax=Priapulus caudatus TaxID=37621 RepID=A0ABM1E7P3_PRICU|nr:PREDICTED: 39S ribosomal protein L14, mitochondrial-like [Priapulus caudatus]